MLKPEQLRAKDDEYDQAAASIYAAYDSTLEHMHARRFRDLVVKPVRPPSRKTRDSKQVAGPF